MKKIILLFFMTALISCMNEEQDGEKIQGYKEYTMSVASRKIPGVVGLGCGSSALTDVYAVKKESSQEWESFWGIQGFDYEDGYEYVIKISETNYLDYRRGDPAWTEYELIKVIYREKKDSQGLPEHFIPEWYTEE